MRPAAVFEPDAIMSAAVPELERDPGGGQLRGNGADDRVAAHQNPKLCWPIAPAAG